MRSYFVELPSRFRKRHALWLLALAAVLTLLNAVKPLLIDDTAYYYNARHLAWQPLDPYDFQIFWYEEPEPANAVLAPLVLPYWWALGIRLLGEEPFLWKLWLFPWSLLLVTALDRLFRRLARGLERPLAVMTVLSPAILPSFNLMLDVPALALGLFAVTTFLGACDDRSAWRALLAGLLAGLTMQTKYTGILVPAIMLAYALCFRRLRLGILAGLAASATFASWETFLALRTGESHFLFQLRFLADSEIDQTAMIVPLVLITGGVAPAQLLLGFVALRGHRLTLLALGALIAFGFLLPALVPQSYVVAWNFRLGGEPFALTWVLFTLSGMLFWGVVAVAAWYLVRRARRTECFLVLWLLLEIAGYFALTPFAAVRRVLGIVVISTILMGRLAAWSCRSVERRRLVWAAALAGTLMGLSYQGVSFLDAWSVKILAERTARLAAAETTGTVWYVGHWGFQFYAERAGLKPVVRGRSLLRHGDVLIMPSGLVHQQQIDRDAKEMEYLFTYYVDDPVPLTTIWCYFGGQVPLRHLEGRRAEADLYRIRTDFVPSVPAPGTTP